MAENLNKEITDEVIETFLNGHDPQERIVNIEYSYRDNFMKVYYRNENDQKCMSMESFYPFVWARLDTCVSLCGGDRKKLKLLMQQCGIEVKSLEYTTKDGVEIPEMKDGYRFMFKARKPMSYTEFLDFFKKCDFPIYSDKKINNIERPFLCVTPQEQFLISTGKRFFKGYDDYNQILRLTFDLETEGLDPTRHRIKLIGIKLNRPVIIRGKLYDNFERIYRLEGNTEQEKNASELKIIDTFLRIIYTFKPDVITAHNGENFDWSFIIERCNQLGTDIDTVSKPYFKGKTIYKNPKESILKLGGEVETFHQTVVPGIIVTDSLHAVRRAQATDSNFKEANLKYSAKYLETVKPNRVYVPGDIIDKTLIDETPSYAFNNNDGTWYKISEDKPIKENYEVVTGKYIVERYLFDDLQECNDVELKLNTASFLLSKILPLSFQKCCTMGTAGQWKSLMMAWSYENNLAIPFAENTGKFTGGLSRLLKVGGCGPIVKLDYNSLYPSIILTWAIEDEKDISGATLKFLNYILTTREKFKGIKKSANKIVEKYEDKINSGQTLTPEENEEYHKALGTFSAADKTQNQMKIMGNSFFGAYGSNLGSVYPWKSVKCAERTTCTGRQSLRLMISHFTKLGYEPIVGDSFTPDTPMFIKYKDSGLIDIKPIEELINEKEIKIDALGREYDYSKKDYYVLCRSGWVEPSYIYRHKTEKDIYEITDGEMKVEVTEDHSLFNSKQEKIKPSEITNKTELEYYTEEVRPDGYTRYFATQAPQAKQMAMDLANGKIDRVPMKVLNYQEVYQKIFYDTFIENYKNDIKYSKTCLAGLQYIRKMLMEKKF